MENCMQNLNILIQGTLDKLQGIFPKARKIDVKIDQTPDGDFRSLVQVFTTGRRFVSKKSSKNPVESLEKARKAVTKQTKKFKRNKMIAVGSINAFASTA